MFELEALRRVAVMALGWKRPGIGLAFILRVSAAAATGSVLPVGAWLCCAIGASFDEGWRESEREPSR